MEVMSTLKTFWICPFLIFKYSAMQLPVYKWFYHRTTENVIHSLISHHIAASNSSMVITHRKYAIKPPT
jgi:hypothetical protein